MIANWVKETVSAGGTGNLTLSGAVTGFIQFSSFFATSQLMYYTIEDGNNREIGIGHLTTATNFVRDKVMETLVSGTYDNTSPTAITVTTAAKVMCAATAQCSVAGLAGWDDNGKGMTHTGLDTTDQANFNVRKQRIQLFPLAVARTISIKALGIDIVTAAAETNMELGIYDIGIDGKPSTLLTSGTAISVATTGYKSQTITEIMLHQGMYLGAFVTDHAANGATVTCSDHTSHTHGNESDTKQHAITRYDSSQTALLADLSAISLTAENTAVMPKFWMESV